MKWIETTGGPFVALPRKRLINWYGVQEDYDLACEVDDYLGLIEFRGLTAIVLGDEPMRTAIVNRNFASYVIRWCGAPNESAVETALEHIADLEFSEPNVRMSVDEGPLVIFDSSLPGAEVSESDMLQADVTPGFIDGSTSLYKPTTEIFLVVHRFQESKSI